VVHKLVQNSIIRPLGETGWHELSP